MDKVVVLKLKVNDEFGDFQEYEAFWLNGQFIGSNSPLDGVNPGYIRNLAYNVYETIRNTKSEGCEFKIVYRCLPEDDEWEWSDYDESMPLTA